MNATTDLQLPLPTLREVNPRDFLASLGLLRLLSLQWPHLDVRLAWNLEAGHPLLTSREPLPTDWSPTLTQALQTVSAEAESPLFHGDVIKTDPANFREHAQRAQRLALHPVTPLHALAPLLYAAYSPQCERDEELQVSLFSFANGQGEKKLLLDVRTLINTLGPEDLRDAADGRTERRSAKSFRWNPCEFRSAAYRSHDPGKGIAGDDTLDIPAFNVLAFFGLTFLPCAPTLGGGETLGMHQGDGGRAFVWPIWETPLRPEAVFSLLAQVEPHSPQRPGVTRLWQSRRFSSDKSLYFSPAKLVR